MEENKGGAGSSARASSSLPPAAPPTSSSNHSPPPPPPPHPPSSSTNPPKEPAAASQRQMFSAELKPGETTIVSWKRLLRESNKGSGDPPPLTAADPALEARGRPDTAVQPSEGELTDALAPPNRFNAVIEKIERLYMGKQSSDEEELDDIPDDDQYDSEDSFIDDAELDEYFQVDKLSTKHKGYFVNRGKLERIEPSSSPSPGPTKRRRKDSTKVHSEKDLAHPTIEPANMGNMRIKAAARSASLVGKKLSSPTKIRTPFENPPSARIPKKDVSSLPLESKDFEKHKAGVVPSRELAYKSRGTNELSDAMYRSSRDRSVSSQVESQSTKLLNGADEAEISTKIRRKERYGTGEYPDRNSSGNSYPMQAVQRSSKQVNEDSSLRPKGTILDRAIRDLEKIVAVCRPPKLDVQEVDTTSQGVKRRLPQEVRQKLAKVARLSASQCKISEKDLIHRLMGIVGHLVQRRTLKKHLREMVELGLSAKQQKADRFQQIKKEVNEMMRTHVSHLKSKVAEQQDGSADDFQEVSRKDDRTVLRNKMDTALEDKICDLYDLYVEGMDEDKGPQSRKLYVELAELWPYGYMDNYGIKDAIYRSKERKRAVYRQHKFRDEERVKRKKLASGIKVETSLDARVQTGQQERPLKDSTSQVLVHPDKAISNQLLSSSGRMAEPTPSLSDSGHHHASKHHDKVRVGSSSSTSTVPDNGSKTAVVDVKKKTKTKSESELGEVHGHPPKLPSLHAMERHSSHRHSSDETNASHQPKQNLLPPPAPGSSNQTS